MLWFGWFTCDVQSHELLYVFVIYECDLISSRGSAHLLYTMTFLISNVFNLN